MAGAAAILASEVRAAFASNDFEMHDETVVKDCVSLLKQFGMDATELADEFEVHVLNGSVALGVGKNGARRVSRVDVAGLRSRVQAARVKRTRAAMDPLGSGNTAMMLSKEDMLENLANTTTPMMKRVKRSSDDDDDGNVLGPFATQTPTPVTEGVMAAPRTSAFKERSQRGLVQVELEAMEEAGGARGAADGRAVEVKLLAADDEATAAQKRTMMNTLQSRAKYLVARMNAFARWMREDGVTGERSARDSDGEEEKEKAAADREVREAGDGKKDSNDGDDAALVLSPLTAASQDEIVAIGRVCCDTLKDGRLNASALLLEGMPTTGASIGGGEGNGRVRLDVSRLKHYSLFPGQVVCVRGKNPSGFCFIADEICDASTPPPLPPAPQDADLVGAIAAAEAAVRKEKGKAKEGEEDSTAAAASEATTTDIHTSMPKRKLMVACGPFTTSEDFAFEPFECLLSNVSTEAPDVLLLVGPFVDVGHAKANALEVTFEEVFTAKVLAPLEAVMRDSKKATTVIIVPSSRDAFHHPVFPQEGFAPASSFGIGGDGSMSPSRIVMAPNPCLFSIDGAATVAVSSTDILKHLAGNEMFKAPAPNAPSEAKDTKSASLVSTSSSSYIADRMSRLSAHLVCQRSFYPLYPPGASTMLDCTLAHPDAPGTSNGVGGVAIGVAPDVMVLPSDLGAFAKRFSVRENRARNKAGKHTVVALNPGRLARGVGGGTYATLSLPGTTAASSTAAATSVHVLRV